MKKRMVFVFLAIAVLAGFRNSPHADVIIKQQLDDNAAVSGSENGFVLVSESKYKSSGFLGRCPGRTICLVLG